jgi:hypothetical protein
LSTATLIIIAVEYISIGEDIAENGIDIILVYALKVKVKEVVVVDERFMADGPIGEVAQNVVVGATKREAVIDQVQEMEETDAMVDPANVVV